MSDVTLTPAYGRDYKSKAAIMADLDANKDFIFVRYGDRHDGAYINKEQLLAEGIKEVRVRYKRLTQQTTLKITEGVPVK
jgi:hypothetical protein